MREIPELWGVAEAAHLLGVSRQRIDQLAEAYPEDLPLVQQLPVSGTRLWRADAWRAFARIPRPGGRPRVGGRGCGERNS